MSARVGGVLVTAVKGLRISARSEVELGVEGVRENRRFFLIDDDARLANGKHLGSLQAVEADYSDSARTLSLRFPDGTVVDGSIATGARVAARFYTSTVAALEVLGPWSVALSEYAGTPLRLVESLDGAGAVDRGRSGGVSLISTASIERLAQAAQARAPVDPRRFRMLLQLDGLAAHAEDEWVGRTVRIGSAAVSVRGHVGRCVVTKRDPDSGDVDLDTLGALASYRRDAATTEPLACGVYGEVLEPGSVRVGDAVELI